VITFWERERIAHKCQTINFIINSSDELPCVPTGFITSQQWYYLHHCR
jgi:hypothetical protein